MTTGTPTETTKATVPTDKMTVAATLPSDWKQEGTFVGRVMLPEGPAVVRLEKNGDLIDITRTFEYMSTLCEQDNPADAANKVQGRRIGTLEEILKNTAEDPTSRTKPRLIAPIDLQTVKAAGVTFADSLIERAVDEKTRGLANETEQEKAAMLMAKEAIRMELKSIIGDEPIKAGSDAALKLLKKITDPVVPAKVGDEPGLGLSPHYFEVGLGRDAEIFTKADTLASVGTGVAAGFLDDAKHGLNNPEPEAVLITSANKDGHGGRVVGAALGNDINHRSIEGRSALLLGECKNQNGTCAVGPFIRLFDDSFSLDDVAKMDVNLEIKNADGEQVYSGTNSMSKISRPLQALVDQMYENQHAYHDGAVLFCGTMCVPRKREDDGADFTHRKGDIVSISTEKLGALCNVMQHCHEIPQPELGLRDLPRNLASRGLLVIDKLKEVWDEATQKVKEVSALALKMILAPNFGSGQDGVGAG